MNEKGNVQFPMPEKLFRFSYEFLGRYSIATVDYLSKELRESVFKVCENWESAILC